VAYRPAAWVMAAVALFLLAVAGYAVLVHAFPQYYWTQIDTAVYRDGGIAARNQPAMLYALELGPAKLPFTYTPFAALLFAAGSGASFATWQAGLAVLTIGLLPVVAYLCLGLAGRPAGPARAAAAFAIAAVGLWLEPVAMTLFFGQINLLLLALVVGDLALPDRIRGKGIGIGLAAGIKLTPLIFIPYLLFTRRVRAAAVGALTFAVTVGLGFALLPHAAAVYWGGQITRPGSKAFHLDNQSVNGVILRLTHAGPDAHAYWLAAAVVVGIAGLATSILASRRGHELLGLVACAATGLLVSPVTWSHHYVYVVPALVLAGYGPRRLGGRILGAALVVGLFGWWPVPLGRQGGYDPRAQLLPRGWLLLAPNRGNNPAAVEFTWRGLELIVGNYYVLTLLVFIAATACALALAGRAPRKVKLVGDVDQLARVELPAAHGQPVGQVRRFHSVLVIPQRLLDRVKDAAQEVSLVSRVVPVRAGADHPVRRPGR
jgi:Glycosyltransferase family 87